MESLEEDVTACLTYLWRECAGWGIEMKSYEVVEYSECMWVRRVGAETPICYFEGTTERSEYLANKAAGLLGVGLAHRKANRLGREQKQRDMVRDLPGVKWWNDAGIGG